MPADDVATLLADVAASLPSGGEDRPGQREMAAAVARAIGSRRHLVVQAGTGTGKSLAYLVPAVVSGAKVVVATATKALQDQLAHKDLPSVAAALERPVAFAILKGRSNYLCVQRATEMTGRGVQQELTGPPAGGSGPDPAGIAAVAGTAAGTSADPEEGGGGAIAPDRLVEQLRALVTWAARTETGDRADLPFEPHPRAWSMLSVGPRECPGAHRCPAGGQCFAERARAKAAEADVVVVNTHLYGAHLASGGAVLPPHDVVVFDEAHEVEGIMTSSLGVELSPGRLRALHSATKGLVEKEDAAATDLADVADRLHDLLRARLGTRVLQRAARHRAGTGPSQASASPARPAPPGTTAPAGRERPFFGLTGDSVPAAPSPASAQGSRSSRGRTARAATPPSGAAVEAAGDAGASAAADGELAELLELAGSRLERLRACIAPPSPETAHAASASRPLRAASGTTRTGKAGAGKAGAGKGGAGKDGAGKEDDGQRMRALTAAGNLAEDLQRLAVPGDGDVAWVDGTARAPVLRLSPVDVAPALTGTLWSAATAVLTSATIPTRIEAQLGLDAFDVDRLDVGSPFDFRSHGLLYVARHLPDRRSPAAEPAIHEELAALIDAAGGRTLALFTSYRAMTAARDALVDRLPYRLLLQGELPKGRLLETFSAEEATCLFATLGFWQGVDVPGRSCSLVTLDRLPFGRPDDPLLEARRELAGDAAFSLVDLPRAASLLAQGVGRLIRSSTDYGVVAVLDPRLATAGYRRALLAALPPLRRTVERQAVVDFLGEVLARPAA